MGRLRQKARRASGTGTPRVVVVGMGFAGLATVKGLSRAGMQVTLVDRNVYSTFPILLLGVAFALVVFDTTLFGLLDAEANTGIALTESFAMTPPASVSGLYFGNPQAHYFGVGKIGQDQVADYARRKGWDVATAERWLAPILAYDPARAREAAA